MGSKVLYEVTEQAKPTYGPEKKVVRVTMEIGVAHYVFLKVLGSQWMVEFPDIVELFVERIFPREFIKFQTIVYTLLRRGMGISDIVTYLIAGERNEERIIWLHKQRNPSPGNDRRAKESGSGMESQRQEEVGCEQAEGESGI